MNKVAWYKNKWVWALIAAGAVVGIVSSSGNSQSLSASSSTSTINTQAPVNTAPAQSSTYQDSSSLDNSYQSDPSYSNTDQSSDNSDQSADNSDQSSDDTTDLSNSNYYTNVDGNSVHSPAYSQDGSVPEGASATCEDGTYSFSQNSRGTCSHHGGVSEWLY